MKIERKNLENSIVEIIVEADAKEVAKNRKKVLDYLQKNADIKGFRKWAKIPESILIKNYWEDYINNMTVDFAIDDLYKKALMQEKIVPVAQGEIKEIISQSPLKIKIHAEVLPKVEIDPKYEKIKLTKKKIEVKADEVKEAIAEIEKKFTKFEEVTDKKSKVAMWDKVTIDTQGYDLDWKELDTTKMENYPLIIGSNVLVPGFEEKIIWAKLWDELNLDIKFPKDYHNKDFAWKDTKFKVVIKKLEKAKKPEFTEEFIEQLRGKKLDLAGFKKLIKEEIKEVKESNARLEEELELIKELQKVSKFEIGKNLLKNQIDKIYAEVRENMGKQGIKMKDYLESLKLTEEEYKEKHLKEDAKLRVSGELILNKLMELKPVKVTKAELEKEIEKIKSSFQNTEVLKRLEELYQEWNKYYEELKTRLSYKKLIDSFFTKEENKKK